MEDPPVAGLPVIDADECSAHRMARLATFLVEGAVAVLAWGLLCRLAGLPDLVVVAGVLVVPFGLAVAGAVLAGGTPVRRLVGLRVVDEATLRSPSPARAVAHEAVRVLSLVVVDTLFVGGAARTYDARQQRWSRTVVVGRPTGRRTLAIVLVAATTSVLAWAMAAAAPGDAAWAVPLVVAVPLGALGGAVGLSAVVGLVTLPPPPGDRVSRLTAGGDWVGVDPDLSLGLAGVRVTGSLDAAPVPRPRADGTVAEGSLASASGIVTRKRRQVGEVEGA